MSDDEYEMTSFKRVKRMDEEEVESDKENELVSPPTQKKKLKKKLIDMDDMDVLNENQGLEDKDDILGDEDDEQESVMSEEENDEAAPVVYNAYRGAQDINFENENDDFIVDDANDQYVYHNVNEGRKQYVDLAIQYFGEEILYFINLGGSGEEVEEGVQEHEVEEVSDVPRTEEMAYAKKAEEAIWKEENLLTDIDLKIVSTDLPERMQLINDFHAISEYQEKIECYNWIYIELLKQGSSLGNAHESEVTEQIARVIECYSEHYHEPHYIMKYESRHLPDLNNKDIWTICSVYNDYLKLIARSRTIKSTVNMLRDHLNSLEMTDGVESLSRLLSDFAADLSVPDEVRMDSISSYVMLLKTLLGVHDSDDAPLRLTKKREVKLRTLFSLGLLDLAAKFNVELDRVSVNITAQYQEALPMDPGKVIDYSFDYMQVPGDLVEELTQQYPELGSAQQEPSKILSDASTLYGLLLSYDPHIIKYSRMKLYDHAMITTNPTDKGVREIDGSHPVYGLHRLRNKPIGDIEDEAFLQLELAEEDDLITYDINVADGVRELKAYLEQLLSVTNSAYTELQKQSVLVCCNALQTDTVQFLKEKIKRRAFEEIARKCGNSLEDIVKYRGFYSTSNRLATVLALAFSSEITASSTGVVLNENGVVVDHIILGRGGRVSKMDESGVLGNVRKVLEKNEVDVIVLNTTLMNQTRLLLTAVDELAETISNEMHKIRPKVLIVDDSVAQLRLMSDNDVIYPEALKPFKLAIYCARYVQNPLREVCSLYNNPLHPEDCDLMQLQLNPNQPIIPAFYLLREYERVLCMEVATAGVCLQEMIAYQDGYGMLQFLPGLGFRKVRAMIEKLVEIGPSLHNRREMKTALGLGDVVFANCGAFITFAVRRLTNIEEISSDSQYNVLDMLRIPVDLYSSVIKICEFLTRGSRSHSGQEAVTEIILHFHNYEKNDSGEYELITYDDERDLDSSINGFSNLPITKIQNELKSAGNDSRDSIGALEEEELFYLIAGETRESFRQGTEVTATVTRITDGERILVRLDNNLQGFIAGANFSDNPRDIEMASNMLEVGDTITCRVESIDVANYRVELNSRPSVVNNRFVCYTSLDPCYQQQPEMWELDILESLSKRLVEEQRARQLVRRHIFNGNWFNVDVQGAYDLLKEKPVGSCLFRPSPHGIDQIVMTYKARHLILYHRQLLDDLFISYDIYEKEKDVTDPTKLGASLELCEEHFMDLEEIVDRFVGQITVLVNDIRCFQKYSGKNDEEVDADVMDIYHKNPSLRPYQLSFSRKQPGLLRVSFFKHDAILHEYAELRSMGILYQKRIFQHVESFMNYFKKNIQIILSKRQVEQSAAASMMHATNYGQRPMSIPSYGPPQPMYYPPVNNPEFNSAAPSGYGQQSYGGRGGSQYGYR